MGPPPDDATSDLPTSISGLSASLPNGLSAFALPHVPRSDVAEHTPPHSHPATASPPPNVQAAPAASKMGKGKAKAQPKLQPKRIKWTNKMVGELLRLRFSDGDVKRRLEAADTKTKKALAWQYFASVLSQSLGIVFNHDQVSLKYRKLKCINRKEKRELKKTGNEVRVSEIDEGFWTILNDAFGGRVGISGEVLLDSAVDEEEEEEDTGEPPSKDDSASKQKPPPVAQLATALQVGMEAVAASLGSRPSSEDQLRVLTASLQQQHEEMRRFQELQLQLLRDILANRKY